MMQIFNILIITLSWTLIIYGYPNRNIIAEMYEHDEDIPEIDPLILESDCKLLCFPITKPTTIKYTLFTRSTQTSGEVIEALNSDSIHASKYNPQHPTRFIAHGWFGETSADVNVMLINSFLTKGDYNIIIVDWSSCARNIYYFQARCCVNNVGQQIAEFVDFLNAKHSLKFNQLTLIGHSLGAHCMGHAGKNMKNGRVNTIVGLDPAKPCFVNSQTDERLASTDAEYVEIIHTNGGLLGFYEPIGHADFYPNSGCRQTGCDFYKPNICSHGRSSKYYAESIVDNHFTAIKCADMNALKEYACNITANDVRMGGDPSNYGKANGIYYLETNTQSPFGVGDISKTN